MHTNRANSVLITGANGGIGLALCSVFQQSGYYVIATDIQPSAKCDCDLYLSADLSNYISDEEKRNSFRNSILSVNQINPLHCLINNAAVQIVGDATTLKASDALSTFNVNVLTAFALIQDCANVLSENSGSIVNISSIHAQLTKPHFSLYAASKAALSELTRALALEFGGKIRVNAIEPAAVSTPMLVAGFKDSPQELEKLRHYHPSGTLADPKEVAELARFLAEAGPSTTGTCISLSGGISSRLHDPI
jgi:NAD(P)-dependent dehydrogenase (short-subunit alcohol dehydrogenase family)